MLLPREQAFRFIDGYKAVLLRILKDTNTPTTRSVNNDLTSARTLVKADRSLLEAALSELEAEGKPVEPAVAFAIRSLRVEQWVYLSHTKTFAVFLDTGVENAYAVQALTTPLNELLDEPPFTFEAGLLEFEGRFICDGLVLNPIALGAGYRSQLKSAYAELRKAGKFHARSGLTSSREDVPLISTVVPRGRMPSKPIAAVMVHVPQVEAALAWYQRAFPEAVRSRIESTNLEFLSIGGIQLELVPSDEKVSSGTCGSVVYWQVPAFEATLSHMQSIGAKLYRGPMQIEGGSSMCQVQDPWGNCIGLRGPSSAAPQSTAR